MRCDFNVPLGKRGEVLDGRRIKESIPTIKYLSGKGAKVIILSHLGRPKAKEKPKFDKKNSLKTATFFLEEVLGKKVIFLNDPLAEKTKEAIEKMEPGDVALAENVRFYIGEEKNSDEFAKKLSQLGDLYVNDAFGVSHRAHASISGLPKYLPSAPGFLLEKEIRILRGMLKNPAKPLVAIVGGAKVETKAKLINRISEIADKVLIGGLIAREIKEKDIYINYPKKIFPPIDEVEGKDIGPKTIKSFKEKIMASQTIFFNGVLGKTEDKRFVKGTEEILEAIIKSKAFSIIGGGETVEFANRLGLISKFNHVSTGGGAMVAFLAGEKLPGLEALK